MFRIVSSLLLSGLIAFFFSSCDFFEDPIQKRAEYALSKKRDIKIGIVDTSLVPSYFVKGARLAIDEFNHSRQIKQKLVPIIADDEGLIEKGQQIAKELVKDPSLIAVVGHQLSSVAISSAITYETNNVLFLSHGATQADLIRDEHRFIFRNIPSDKIFAQDAAAFTERNAYQKIAILYERVFSSRRFAELYQNYAVKHNINVTAVKSYSGWQKDYSDMIGTLVAQADFEAILLCGELPAGAEVVKQLRKMGIQKPIIATTTFDSYQLWDIAGKAAKDVIVPTTYNSRLLNTRTRDFVRRFRSTYGVAPDTWAAQGYDAISVIIESMIMAKSQTPIQIAKSLRFTKDRSGVSGKYSFTKNGNITGKHIFYKSMNSGTFQYLESELNQSINLFETIVEETLMLPIDRTIESIDPGKINDAASMEVAEQLFLGLTGIEPNTYSVIPELATKWLGSGQNKKFRFQLREDVKWTNGEPVTAHDIVATIRRNLTPDVKCPDVNQLYIIKNAEAFKKGTSNAQDRLGVTAIDDFTIEFVLKRSKPDFPALVSLGVFTPVYGANDPKSIDTWSDPIKIPTNGPYQLRAWKKGLVMVLRKNKNYFDDQNVAIPEIRYFEVRGSSIGLELYKNKQLDIIGGKYLQIPDHDLAKMETTKNWNKQIHTKAIIGTYAYGFDTSLTPVNGLLVRKAVTSAIDRELITRMVAPKGQVPIKTFLPGYLLNAPKSESAGIAFDPLQAKQWLAEAGYPDGEGFPVLTVLHGNHKSDQIIAEAILSLLKYHLNITIKLQSQPSTETLATSINRTRPHLFQMNRTVPYPSPEILLVQNFHPDESDNLTRWQDQAFITLIEKGRKGLTHQKRAEIWQQAENMITRDWCLVAPIYSTTVNYLVNPRVKGWTHTINGGQQIKNWRLKPNNN